MATFGERLKNRRMASGYSQAELAELIGCAPQLISYYETSNGVPRKDEILGGLCDALDTTREWLTWGIGKMVASEADEPVEPEKEEPKEDEECRVYTINDVKNLDNINTLIKHLQILPIKKDEMRSLHKTLSEFRTELESKVLFGERRYK